MEKKEQSYKEVCEDELLNDIGIIEAEGEKWLERWTKAFEENFGLKKDMIDYIFNFARDREKLWEMHYIANNI